MFLYYRHMEEIWGSRTKASILYVLALRGGCSGRRMARLLKMAPTPVFKALAQLIAAKIIRRAGSAFYALNPDYPHYLAILQMVEKELELHGSKFRGFYPVLPEERRVDPLAVYEIASLRGATAGKAERFSDVLRNKYG